MVVQRWHGTTGRYFVSRTCLVKVLAVLRVGGGGSLQQEAAEAAKKEFCINLRALLMQPPLQGAVVLGLDPGFTSGCKVAVCGATGAVVHTSVIYPFSRGASRGGSGRAREELKEILQLHGVEVVSIGDGTASRDTEMLVSQVLKELRDKKPFKCRYAIVSEAGASVYSTSPGAVAELPDLDCTLRGAVSIARRLQDPLAELVKIDPNAIGEARPPCGPALTATSGAASTMAVPRPKACQIPDELLTSLGPTSSLLPRFSAPPAFPKAPAALPAPSLLSLALGAASLARRSLARRSLACRTFEMSWKCPVPPEIGS
ncbi:hypothetical protein CYMTET_56588 [Cymbomonas tetramitiformis]|uniref:YqgF/RNase H-like domain-containing protein n=1 Tax=Cymbomonas tetramitiformis TaxID=36881 RepID=A0AAE0BBW3_9CHLO|nr:hypothetical protein CYMTET_56588 [Cymbomonas tetramitiformis]